MNLTKEQLEIVKKEHPEFFKFKDNTWYISKSGTLQFNQKDGHGYGLRGGTDWFDSCYWMRGEELCNRWEIANIGSVHTLLRREAIRRGLISDKHETTFDGETMELVSPKFGRYIIFQFGEFAKNGHRLDLNKDIQALKDKYPQYKITITVE